MINKTAFIIGAGASKAYSLPTGEDLRQEIFNMRVNFGLFENQLFSTWYSKDSFYKFIDTFKLSGLKSIDTFLKLHPEFENEGKACIAYLIKTHEMHDYENLYARNDWLFLLYNRLIDGILNPEEQFTKDSVYFVTFNYDRLLEYYLINSIYNAFSNNSFIRKTYDEFRLTHVEKYFQFNIDHIYGQIGDLNSNPINQNSIENIHECMNEIKIIGDRAPEIDKIKNKLSKYDRIFLLGYGYDSENNRLLELNRLCTNKLVYGTCYQYLNEEIRKIRKSISSTANLIDCTCNDLLRKYL